MNNNINMLALFVIFYFVAHTSKGVSADDEEIKIIKNWIEPKMIMVEDEGEVFKTFIERHKEYVEENICKKDNVLLTYLKYSWEFLQKTDKKMIQESLSHAEVKLDVKFEPEIEQNQSSFQVSTIEFKIMYKTALEYCRENIKNILINLSGEPKVQIFLDKKPEVQIFLDKKPEVQIFLDENKYEEILENIYTDINKYNSNGQNSNSTNLYTEDKKFTIFFVRLPYVYINIIYNLDTTKLKDCIKSMTDERLIRITSTSYTEYDDWKNKLNYFKTTDTTPKIMEDYIKKYKDDSNNVTPPRRYCIDISILSDYENTEKI